MFTETAHVRLAFLALGIAACSSELDQEEGLAANRSSLVKANKLAVDTTQDSSGQSTTSSPNPITLSTSNPFANAFGTNGRACTTCHHEDQGWTITPAFARTLASSDPLFVFDGSDCLPPGEANPSPSSNSTEMLNFGNIRIDLAIPASADYQLVGFTDPLQCPPRRAPPTFGSTGARSPAPTPLSSRRSCGMAERTSLLP
jgi:hypothetical protein